MASEITKFPISYWQRMKNKRGMRTVNCEISGRYIIYEKAAGTDTKMGPLVMVNIMTDGNNSDTPDRKICEMALSVDDLRKMIITLENDLIKKPTD